MSDWRSSNSLLAVQASIHHIEGAENGDSVNAQADHVISGDCAGGDCGADVPSSCSIGSQAGSQATSLTSPQELHGDHARSDWMLSLSAHEDLEQQQSSNIIGVPTSHQYCSDPQLHMSEDDLRAAHSRGEAEGVPEATTAEDRGPGQSGHGEDEGYSDLGLDSEIEGKEGRGKVGGTDEEDDLTRLARQKLALRELKVHGVCALHVDGFVPTPRETSIIQTV